MDMTFFIHSTNICIGPIVYIKSVSMDVYLLVIGELTANTPLSTLSLLEKEGLLSESLVAIWNYGRVVMTIFIKYRDSIC